jgi:hypothetical protein
MCHTVSTVDGARTKSVVIKTQGYEKILVTVMLAISADGSTLSPRVILNHKITTKEQLLRGIIATEKIGCPVKVRRIGC